MPSPRRGITRCGRRPPAACGIVRIADPRNPVEVARFFVMAYASTASPGQALTLYVSQLVAHPYPHRPGNGPLSPDPGGGLPGLPIQSHPGERQSPVPRNRSPLHPGCLQPHSAGPPGTEPADNQNGNLCRRGGKLRLRDLPIHRNVYSGYFNPSSPAQRWLPEPGCAGGGGGRRPPPTWEALPPEPSFRTSPTRMPPVLRKQVLLCMKRLQTSLCRESTCISSRRPVHGFPATADPHTPTLVSTSALSRYRRSPPDASGEPGRTSPITTEESAPWTSRDPPVRWNWGTRHLPGYTFHLDVAGD